MAADETKSLVREQHADVASWGTEDSAARQPKEGLIHNAVYDLKQGCGVKLPKSLHKYK